MHGRIYYGEGPIPAMVRPYLLVVVALLAPAAAFAQTYDTPQTLAISLEPPYYTYVDADGYSVTTGMVVNESDASYVGNVIVLAKFYGDMSSGPLDTVSARTLLEVIPPGSASPYIIRSGEPDPRISAAVATLLLFDPVGPKQAGLDMQYTNGTIRVSDAAGAPHTNVTVHVAYHDAFDPPRILGADTYSLGGMGIGGMLNLTAPGAYPPNTRGALAFAESDVFSSGAISWRAGTHAPAPPPLPAYILDAWVSDHAGGRTLSAPAGADLALNAAVEVSGEGEYRLYVQVTSRDTGGVEFLESVAVDGGAAAIPWTPANEGEYIVEMFLWGEGGAPASRPSPILLLSVE